MCNISGHRSAINTNEESISIRSRSGNRSLVVAIACKYNFPRWRPQWRQNRYLYMYVSGHRSATKTNKESISIILRSASRSPLLAIAFKCNFPRWRSKWRPKQIFVCAAHRSGTKTNKKSISITSRSTNRYLVVAIAWKSNFSRWRPIWPLKQIFVYLSS